MRTWLILTLSTRCGIAQLDFCEKLYILTKYGLRSPCDCDKVLWVGATLSLIYTYFNSEITVLCCTRFHAVFQFSVTRFLPFFSFWSAKMRFEIRQVRVEKWMFLRNESSRVSCEHLDTFNFQLWRLRSENLKCSRLQMRLSTAECQETQRVVSRVQGAWKLRRDGNSRVGLNVSPQCSFQVTEIFQEYDIDGHHLWLWIVNEL